MKVLTGIFVGGKGSRMGGVAKGLLRAPGGETTLIERTAALVSRHLYNDPTDGEVVLVGEHPAYAAKPWRSLPDHPPGIGPLGGLIALLEEAARLDQHALAIACDLPYLTGGIIERIASERASAVALAPKFEGWWQPLFARYQPEVVLDVARQVERGGRRSLQAVLSDLGPAAEVFELAPDLQDLLDDWDTPEDMGDDRRDT